MPPRADKFVWPDLTSSRCNHLDFGGEIQGSDDLVGKFADQSYRYRAKMAKKQGHDVSLYINLHKSESGKNLHLLIDIVRNDSMFKTAANHKSATLSRVVDLLSPLMGATYNAAATAHFTVKPDEMPPVIRRSSEPFGTGVRLQMYSGWYALTGTPIQGIRWFRPREQPDYTLSLDYYIGGPLDPLFFKNTYITLEDFVSGFLVKET